MQHVISFTTISLHCYYSDRLVKTSKLIDHHHHLTARQNRTEGKQLCLFAMYYGDSST